MAGERLYGEFTDDKGTDWRVSIYDTNAAWDASNATEFTLGAEGFVIRYSGNNEQQHQPIIGSSVEFTLFENVAAHTQTLDLLYSFAEGRLLLDIYRDPDGDNTVYWRGVILAEQVERNDEPFPTAVRLTASDGLGNLKDIDFPDDSSGLSRNVRNQITRCLLQVPTISRWGNTDALLRYVNDTENFGSHDDADALDNIIARAPVPVLENGAENPHNCFDILHSLASSFNARVFLAEGVFWFWPINVHQRVSDAEAISTSVKQYDKQGNAVSWTASDITAMNVDYIQSSGTEYQKLAGHVFTHLPPVRHVERTRRIDGNMYVVRGNDDTVVTTGVNITEADTDRTYEVGAKFRVYGSLEFQASPDASQFEMQEDFVHVELEIMLKAGTKYYQPEEWTTDNTDHYVIDLAQFLRSQGANLNTAYSFTTIPLTTEENGLDVEARVYFYDEGGQDISSNFTSNEFYLDLGVEVVSDNGANDDLVTYRASFPSTNELTVDQGEVLFGDNISHAAQGTIYGVNGGTRIYDEWKSSQSAGPLGLHRLGVTEALARQKFATKIHRGTVYGLIEMWHTMLEDSEYYVPFEISTNMNMRESTVERYKIAFDSTSITSAQDTPRSVGGTRGGTLDLINGTINTITQQVQQPKPSVGGNVVTPGSGRAVSFSDVQGPVFHRVIQVEHTSGSTYTIEDSDYGYMYTNSYIDAANGFGTIVLPKVANNEGRMLSFKTDSTLHANKYVVISVNADEVSNGVRIDGATSYTMDRDYDGLGVLCYDGQWFIVQKKEKGGGAVQELDGELLEFITRDTTYANSDYEGQVVKYGSDTLVAGKFYTYASGGWTATDADAENQTRGLIGVALGTNSGTDGLLVRGIHFSSTYNAFSAGQIIYLSTTGGTVTTTAPSASGDFVRVIGYALGSRYIYLDPSPNYIEL